MNKGPIGACLSGSWKILGSKIPGQTRRSDHGSATGRRQRCPSATGKHPKPDMLRSTTTPAFLNSAGPFASRSRSGCTSFVTATRGRALHLGKSIGRSSAHCNGAVPLMLAAVSEGGGRSEKAVAKEGTAEGLTYAASGVDIDVEAASVSALVSSLRAAGEARKPGELGASVAHAGGFSGLIEFGDRLLALCTDGVGSKMQLAAELRRYDTVGIDCVAMNVNDLLCIGAEPLAFVDYIAAPAPDPVTWAALGTGLARGCAEARVTLSGGESASLPDMVTHVDMSGTALGYLPKGSQLDGRAVSPGDAIIGLPASGVHSNGLSLVRRVLSHAQKSLDDPLPFDPHTTPQRARDITPNTLGDVFLTPTRIYVDPIVDLINACRGDQPDKPCEYHHLHGMVHVTGGGLSNFLRLNKDVGFVIDNPLPVLPEFHWLQQAAAVSNFEMWRTFNMGMGFALVVSASAAPAVIEFLSQRIAGCQQVGTVTSSAGKIQHVSADVLYDKY